MRVAPAVAASDLRMTFGVGLSAVHAISGIDLAVSEGELVCVMGPSGSGKSTLLHLLAGLRRPTTGSVRIAGTELSALDEDASARFRRRHIGLVFQFFHLVPTLSIVQNVALPLLLDGLPLRSLAKRTDELFAALGLEHVRSRALADLSGGELQRVAIARALLPHPRLVLADEPTGSLDSKSAAETLALLEDACRREGATVVVMTHDPTVARSADRLILLRDGQVEKDELRPRARV
jgi:putative ABC transport system ATP-binding protein